MLDVAIVGGTIVDGTGEPSYPADIGISGDKIEIIGLCDAIIKKMLIKPFKKERIF